MDWQPEEKWMEEALKCAAHAFEMQEVPVGAVIIYKGELIASSYNTVEADNDASCHAEILCLQKAAHILGNWRLQDCTLYCTLEPCCMCYGAMVHFRLPRLVWGAPDLRHGVLGSWYDLSLRPHLIHRVDYKGNFMSQECGQLMRDFFQNRREYNARQKRGASSFEDGS